MRIGYRATFYTACAGYVVQAIVNLLPPLLFIIYETEFGLTQLQITSIISLNFIIQLTVDLASAKFVDKIGYRTAAIVSQCFAAVGLVCMGTLPYLFGNTYAGIITSTVLCAVGGGLLEVIISPIVEALPTEGKPAGAMSLLHAAYCWGCVAMIALSTIYLSTLGRGVWRWLPILWALVPVADLVLFTRVPLCPLVGEEQIRTPLRSLLKSGLFWILFLLMLCSGASELAMSQWASLFAETGLQVSKTVGDLLGPCLFSLLMALSRTWFGNHPQVNLYQGIAGSAVLCVFSYLVTVLSPWPMVALLGCGLCGFSVGIFWPGTFSLAAKQFPTGGTAMFALFALAGDFGCSFGPGLVGAVSGWSGGKLSAGLASAVCFPIFLLIGLAALVRGQKKQKEENQA